MSILVTVFSVILAALFILALGRELAIYTTTVRKPADGTPRTLRGRLALARRKAAQSARPVAKATGVGLTGAMLASVVGVVSGAAVILLAVALLG